MCGRFGTAIGGSGTENPRSGVQGKLAPFCLQFNYVVLKTVRLHREMLTGLLLLKGINRQQVAEEKKNKKYTAGQGKT